MFKKSMLFTLALISSASYAESELNTIDFFFECKILPYSFKLYSGTKGVSVIASNGSSKKAIKDINYSWSGTGNCSHRTFRFNYDDKDISISEPHCTNGYIDSYKTHAGSIDFGKNIGFWCVPDHPEPKQEAGLCVDAQSNLEINGCLHEEMKKVQEIYNVYADEVRRIHYQELAEEFKTSFEARVNEFHTYAESKCTARNEYSKGYTKASTDYARCMIDIHERETLDLWYDFIERQITELTKP